MELFKTNTDNEQERNYESMCYKLLYGAAWKTTYENQPPHAVIPGLTRDLPIKDFNRNNEQKQILQIGTTIFFF